MVGGISSVCKGGLNHFVVTVDTVGDGVTRKLNAISGRTKTDGTWCNVVSNPGSSGSQRVEAVNSSPVPPVCWSTAATDVDEDWPEEWGYDWEGDWR